MRSGGGPAGRSGVPAPIGFCTTGARVNLAEKPANANCHSAESCDLLAPEGLGELQGRSGHTVRLHQAIPSGVSTRCTRTKR